jgi:hypothetical protein
MPPEFPATTYDAIHAAVTQRGPMSNDYAGAWNAVPYRYLAMIEHSDAFAASIKQHGPAPVSEERYRQERDLFGFFTNGLSTLESAFYGTFAIGHCLDAAAFPLHEPRDITPTFTRDRYSKTFPGDALVTTFDAVLNSAVYKELRDLRNVLAHRTASHRHIFLQAGIPKTVRTDEWEVQGKRIPLESNLTTTRQAGVAGLLATLLEGVRDFVARRF